MSCLLLTQKPPITLWHLNNGVRQKSRSLFAIKRNNLAKKLTMSEISYGIETPSDLLEKLHLDGEKIGQVADKFDLFNFFITAASLYEWTVEHHKSHASIRNIIDAVKNKDSGLFPAETASWIANLDCVPNRHCDLRRHVWNSIQICRQTANASKHYHWCSRSDVQAIEESPQVKTWYQHLTTSRMPGVFIEYAGEYYTVAQIKEILLQFYDGLLQHIGQDENGSDVFAS